MYPRPIPEADVWQRRLYVFAVVIVLLLWLCPLFAIILTSFRSTEDVGVNKDASSRPTSQV